MDTIATSARSALVDAQHVIEGIHDDGMETPQPQLHDINTLVEGMRQGSLKIHQSESGQPVELSSGQQVAVFRIVQECLTNALKHGGRGTEVRLHFDWSGPGLTLHVASTMPPRVTVFIPYGNREISQRKNPDLREAADGVPPEGLGIEGRQRGTDPQSLEAPTSEVDGRG